jgi:hypothetical protein
VRGIAARRFYCLTDYLSPGPIIFRSAPPETQAQKTGDPCELSCRTVPDISSPGPHARAGFMLASLRSIVIPMVVPAVFVATIIVVTIAVFFIAMIAPPALTLVAAIIVALVATVMVSIAPNIDARACVQQAAALGASCQQGGQDNSSKTHQSDSIHFSSLST